MSKKSEDLQKKTLNLYRGDFERVAELFPDIEPSVVIRKVIRDFISKVEGQPILPEVKVDL